MKGRKRFNLETKERIIGLCFVCPALIYMLVLIGYPIIYNIVLSFQDVVLCQEKVQIKCNQFSLFM